MSWHFLFLSSGIFILFVKPGAPGAWVLGPGLEMQKVCLRSPAGVRERGLARVWVCEREEGAEKRKRQGTASEVGREEPERVKTGSK